MNDEMKEAPEYVWVSHEGGFDLSKPFGIWHCDELSKEGDFRYIRADIVQQKNHELALKDKRIAELENTIADMIEEVEEWHAVALIMACGMMQQQDTRTLVKQALSCGRM